MILKEKAGGFHEEYHTPPPMSVFKLTGFTI